MLYPYWICLPLRRLQGGLWLQKLTSSACYGAMLMETLWASEDCLFRFWVPKRSPFFSRSPLSPFQTEERDKSQSSHYLLNVDHLNTCDDKTSFNESHTSLSAKLSFVLKYSNTCTCFLLCISGN